MKPSKRKYTGITQFFHNFEHSKEGTTHCAGPPSNPYRIAHYKGQHIINTSVAKGHGRGNKPQWFEFTEKLGPGYKLTSGRPITAKEDLKKAMRLADQTKSHELFKQADRIFKKNRHS